MTCWRSILAAASGGNPGPRRSRRCCRVATGHPAGESGFPRRMDVIVPTGNGPFAWFTAGPSAGQLSRGAGPSRGAVEGHVVSFIVATGIECSAPLIAGGLRRDQLLLTEHWSRVEEDLDL